MKLWKPIAAATAAALTTGLMVAPASAADSATPEQAYRNYVGITDAIFSPVGLNATVDGGGTVTVMYRRNASKTTITMSGGLFKATVSEPAVSPSGKTTTARTAFYCQMPTYSVVENCVAKVGRDVMNARVSLNVINLVEHVDEMGGYGGRDMGKEFITEFSRVYSDDAGATGRFRFTPPAAIGPPAPFGRSVASFTGRGTFHGLTSFTGNGMEVDGQLRPYEANMTLSSQVSAKWTPTSETFSYAFRGTYTTDNAPMQEYMGGVKHSGAVTVNMKARGSRIRIPAITTQGNVAADLYLPTSKYF